MAVRKLSLPLFPAKTLVPQPRCSKHYFHFIDGVNLSIHRNVSTITTRGRTTGKVDSKTFIGRTPLPSDFDGKK